MVMGILDVTAFRRLARLRSGAASLFARHGGLQGCGETLFDSETSAEVLHEVEPRCTTALNPLRHGIETLRAQP